MGRSTVSRLGIVCLAIVAGGLLVSAERAAQVHAAGQPDGHDMGHMEMTKPRPLQPGDKERAATIAAAARKAAEPYRDYRKALQDGYKIFLPEVPQHVYHFTRNDFGLLAMRRFDPEKPTSLLYEKTPASELADGKPEFKLLGVMYTDRYGAAEDELNSRVPLSIAQWHLHTDLCLPPRSGLADIEGPNAKFGLKGSITTAAACQAAGGRFLPHLFGWMVHVYPFETDPAKIWSAGMDDDHGMQHDAMPGMKMGPGDKM
jgi:hypothetical protein